VTSSLALGLLLALASAAALNGGFFAQHGAAAELPPLRLRRPLRSLATLFGSRRWTLGFVTGLGGWSLYVAALALAPLSLVQAASAGGIGVLALLVWRASASRPRARDVQGVALATGGLVLLGISLAGQKHAGGRVSWVLVTLWIAVSAAVALVAVLPRSALRSGAAFGLAAGLLYAAGDVATKAAVAAGSRLVFAPVVLACHGLAFVVLQLGFQRGGALATAGVASLFTNAVPIVAGMTIFHEGMPAGLLGATRLAAFVAVVAGATALARPATEQPERPQARRRLVREDARAVSR
jgi:hypothetical protein